MYLPCLRLFLKNVKCLVCCFVVVFYLLLNHLMQLLLKCLGINTGEAPHELFLSLFKPFTDILNLVVLKFMEPFVAEID